MGIAAGYESAESFKEILSIIVIQEDFAPLNSSANNVVQRTRGIDSRLAWHAGKLSKGIRRVNLFY